MGRYINIFTRPSLVFNEIKRKALFKNGLAIWGVYSILFFLTAFLISEEVQKRDYIYFQHVGLSGNLLFSILMNISVIIVIAFITNMVAKLLKGKSQFRHILTSYLFILLIPIAFIPLQVVASLSGVSYSIYSKISWIPIIWMTILSFIAIKVVYAFPIKRSILTGSIAWSILLLGAISAAIFISRFGLLKDHMERGKGFMQVFEFDKAVKEFKLAIEANPMNVEAHCNLGRAYHGLMSFQKGTGDVWYYKAINAYRQALQIDPNCVKAYIGLGLLYQEKGLRDKDESLYEEAIEKFNQAIRIDPNCYQAYENIGILYIKQNKIDLAISQFKKALEIRPHDKLKQEIMELENKIGKVYTYNMPPERYRTKCKKDVVARIRVDWKIKEPIIFLNIFEDKNMALIRMDDVLYPQIALEFALHPYDEVINNERKKFTLERIIEKSNEEMNKWGIEIIDIQIEEIVPNSCEIQQ
jgi:tetratricopeptide (TPR) repeat protein